MSIRVGDSIFQSSGKVGIVRRVDQDNGEILAESPEDLGSKELRHGYINNLNDSERQVFHETLDQVNGMETAEKVKSLTESIEKMRANPGNGRLVQYLQSQLSHIMQSENYQPRTYAVDTWVVE